MCSKANPEEPHRYDLSYPKKCGKPINKTNYQLKYIYSPCHDKRIQTLVVE